ncbi:hypothetical protein ACQCVP_07230 [Rossellomorea vietnamensis]|uniref:hypothetical protein n=1 Tax=Rossellomorea vietnamensis TaxID=218284 RepID=UPI003CFA9EAC
MSGIIMVITLVLLGGCIAFTIVLASKALHNYFNQNKGLVQNTGFVICPSCSMKNKRQKNGQQCKKCYTQF